jgi:hypothetical protein
MLSWSESSWCDAIKLRPRSDYFNADPAILRCRETAYADPQVTSAPQMMALTMTPHLSQVVTLNPLANATQNSCGCNMLYLHPAKQS